MYVRVVMKLEIHGIELVVIMVDRNDVGDESSPSPMLPKVFDEEGVECRDVLTQPSQEIQGDTDADEPPSLAVMKQY
jgi:hypothetical protein